MAEDAAYQALLQELQAPQQVSNGPTYSPDEVRRRIAQNNQMIQLGLMGQLSGDQAAANVGGQIFRQALADRDERQTQRGIQDPLTGETKLDPAYIDDLNRQRRGQVLQQALGYENKRQSDAAAERRAQENHQARMAEIQERGGLARAIAAQRQNQGPKPPPGYRYTQDGQAMEAIPGGPADIKNSAAAAKVKVANDKAHARDDETLAGIDHLLTTVADAKSRISGTTAGTAGNYIGYIKGTPAYDLHRTLDTIKANLGFDTLTKMRQMSPTGGALGNVSNQEIKYLQSAVANLDQGQSPAQLSKNLDDIAASYGRWKQAILAARGEGSGDADPVPARGGAPDGAPTPAPAQGGAVRLVWDPATGKLVPKQ